MSAQPNSVKTHSLSESPLQNQAVVENSSSQAQTPPVLPSCGELERSVGQALQKTYRQTLGHLPTRVSCHLFADKLSIWIENSLTPVESILLSQHELAEGSTAQTAEKLSNLPDDQHTQEASTSDDLANLKYAQDIRDAIDGAMQHQLKKVIEDCLGVSVITLVSGTSYEQDCTSLTALLSNTPTVRNPERIPKTSASRQANRKSAAKESTD